MTELQSKFDLQQLIVIRGEKGALVLSGNDEFHSVIPEPVKLIVDTVSAGDAIYSWVNLKLVSLTVK